jgi:hypothetical protein
MRPAPQQTAPSAHGINSELAVAVHDHNEAPSTVMEALYSDADLGCRVRSSANPSGRLAPAG